jgi:hypothetical protein
MPLLAVPMPIKIAARTASGLHAATRPAKMAKARASAVAVAAAGGADVVARMAKAARPRKMAKMATTKMASC